jgi:hypothetical protein
MRSRPSALLILSLLLAAPASRAADDAAKPAASSGDEIASFSLKGFDLAAIKTFDFAPDVSSCLVDLTMALGPLGILAPEEGDEPDVLADCRTDDVAGEPPGAGKTLSVTAVTLSDPRTHLIVWWGFDASPEKPPPLKLQRVVDRLRADRAAQAKQGSSQRGPS